MSRGCLLCHLANISREYYSYSLGTKIVIKAAMGLAPGGLSKFTIPCDLLSRLGQAKYVKNLH